MDEIFEATVPVPAYQKKPAAVMVGRLNPPTRGHYLVIDRMKAYIRQHPELKLDVMPVVVVIAGKKTSEDKERNPLTADERTVLIESSGRANGVRVLKAADAFDAFVKVREAGLEPLAIAGGDDRAKKYADLLKKHFKRNGKEVERHVISIDRNLDNGDLGPEALDKILDMIEDGDKVSDKLISASLARQAAREGREKAFAYITGLEDKPALANKLMKKIRGATSD